MSGLRRSAGEEGGRAGPSRPVGLRAAHGTAAPYRTGKARRPWAVLIVSLSRRRFCTPCLQECLKPKKPVCGVCRGALTAGSRALDLEQLIESTETACSGCGKKVGPGEELGGLRRVRCAVTAPRGDADPALFSIGSSKLPKAFGLVANTEVLH